MVKFQALHTDHFWPKSKAIGLHFSKKMNEIKVPGFYGKISSSPHRSFLAEKLGYRLTFFPKKEPK